MRAFLSAISLVIAACSQPPGPPEPPAPAAPQLSFPEAARAEILEAALPVVSEAIGQPVSLAPSTLTIQDDWAWLIVQPQTPDGAALDWSTTRFAEAADQGVLDGGGATYILLRRENGAWRVLEHVVGPTDVAWLDWPTSHGAPPELLDLAPD